MEEHRLALPPGYRIENYEIQAVLGKGGFGITYVAYDWTLGRRMAIKELLPDTIATRIDGSTVVAMGPSHEESWQWARERFVEEARILAGFRHPNIIAVHRLIEANGTVYLVMDHLEGESYEARLRRIGREPDQESLMAVIGPLLDGLREVHAAGLLHRDIKPENILFDKRGNPVLIDFGAARATVGATMTMTSIVTHGYSPIEQYQTKGKMGPWTDIYAIGAVMNRAITGEKPPVASDRIMEDDFLWLSSRPVVGFSVPCLQAVDWALRVRPEERPKSIPEWEIHLSGAGESRQERGMGRMPMQPDQEEARGTPPQPSRSEALSYAPPAPLLIAVVAAIVLLGMFFAMGMIIRSRESENRVDATKVAEKVADKASEFDPDEFLRTYAPNGGMKGSEKATKESPFENSLGMKFVPVPGTDVLFSIWDTRVKDYAAFVAATAYDAGQEWKEPGFQQTPNDPVVNVSWDDAKAFCQWLTWKERGDGKIGKDQEYRLPTDTEWSVAVGLPTEIGGTPEDKNELRGVYPWGTQWPPPIGVGNYAPSLEVDSYVHTSPVGTFPANQFGLYDMGGNVRQWCEDWYSTEKTFRVVRGGSWYNGNPDLLWSTFRYGGGVPDYRFGIIGFRCVLGGGSSR